MTLITSATTVGTVGASHTVADVESIKAFHRAFPTGVTIVTGQDADGQPVGLAVNAFSSVSMDPPMALVCINRGSKSHDTLYDAAHIGVSVLSHAQVRVAQIFASSGGDKFGAVEWHRAENGSPLISGAASHLEMQILNRVEAGTHTIFFGIISQADASGDPSLVYSAGAFFDGAQLVPAELAQR